eukprot:3108960-Rhodomonas_salina.1
MHVSAKSSSVQDPAEKRLRCLDGDMSVFWSASNRSRPILADGFSYSRFQFSDSPPKIDTRT